MSEIKYENLSFDDLNKIIIKLIKNECVISKKEYMEILKSFALKNAYSKTGIYPQVVFSEETGRMLAHYNNSNGKCTITINPKIVNQKDIIFNLEMILHEIRHMYQSCSMKKDNSIFHNIIKDDILSVFFEQYYDDNYTELCFEKDAIKVSNEELTEYLGTFDQELKEKYISFVMRNRLNFMLNNFNTRRIINKEEENYNKYKYYDEMNQLFDRVMLDFSSIIDIVTLCSTQLNKNEVISALSMQYNLNGKLKSILEYINNILSYENEIKYLDTTDKDEQEHLTNLINVYNSFIYNRSYTAPRIAYELLTFTNSSCNDIKQIEKINKVINYFFEIVLNSQVFYEHDNDIVYINQYDIKYVENCLKEIIENYKKLTFTNDNQSKLLKENYGKSIEILKILKEDMLEKKNNISNITKKVLSIFK